MLVTEFVFEDNDIWESPDIGHFSEYRSSRIHQCRNREVIICRTLASVALKRALKKLGLSEENMLYSENEFGKPFFANRDDLFFSISHTKGLAAAAISDIPIGIDCEKSDRIISGAFFKRFFSGTELAAYSEHLISLWTAKEAYTKMRGLPFSECVRDIELPFFEDEIEINGVHFEKKSLNGFIISVAQNKII